MYASDIHNNKVNDRRARQLGSLQMEKRLQLGLAIGTASNRLRKLVFFNLLQETGKDKCFRCGLKIANVDDLVFDHKIPWLHNSADLFWDVRNVAFSHSLCNWRASRRGAARRRKADPTIRGCCRNYCAFPPLGDCFSHVSKWAGRLF